MVGGSTDDNHRQAAFKALHDSFAADVEASTGIDRSIWYDRVEDLIERRAARLRGCSSSKKGKRSTSEGKRSTSGGKRGTFRGKRGTSEGKRPASEGKRGNFEGERRAVKGERSNSRHERGNNLREGAADEPLAAQSPGARNESALAGRTS